jgi:FAD/FMN-containing dehydrogenase
MPNLTTVTLHGDEISLPESAVADFGLSIRGGLILSGDPEYDDARTVFNRMMDRRPAMIARCAGTADVIRAVKFAREHDLLVAVRAAGT